MHAATCFAASSLCFSAVKHASYSLSCFCVRALKPSSGVLVCKIWQGCDKVSQYGCSTMPVCHAIMMFPWGPHHILSLHRHSWYTCFCVVNTARHACSSGSGICRFKEVFYDETYLAIVVEYASQGHLSSLLKRQGTLPEADARG